jgi:hypothetical protein
MFATNRERLTRRATGYQVHRTSVVGPIDVPHILANKGPITSMLNAVGLVQAQGCEGIGVPLDHQFVVESSSGRTEGEAAATAEQFDAAHMLLTSK